MSKPIPDPNTKQQHSLSEIHAEKMTAICGPTEIRKRKLLKKYTAYICATKKLEYAREYRLERFHPNPHRYGPSSHILSEVDYLNKTAVCTQCASVKIYVWRTKNTIGRRCSKANKQSSTRALQKRQKANIEFIDKYKVQQGCKSCGYKDKPGKLHLHYHLVDDNDEKIWKLLKLGRERLLKELKKRKVLCVDCHRLTHDKLGWTGLIDQMYPIHRRKMVKSAMQAHDS